MTWVCNIRETFRKGQGIFRLIPTFVPRRFGQPGRRLRLHPDDYYAFGAERGAIKERWFASVIPAVNGTLAKADEGLSYVDTDGDRSTAFTLRDAVKELGPELIGEQLHAQYGNWPMYAKFFDYATPLFHHLHLDFDAASKVDRLGKPEAYFFPAELNNHLGQFPATYMGFDPDVTRDQVRERLLQYRSGDNRITELSRAYRIQLDTGWYMPAGVLHSPGSVLTYEPQWNSDVNSVYENVVAGEVYPHEFLVENCPADKQNDVDYVLDLMDWPKNVDPHFRKTYFRPPIEYARYNGAREQWIAYGNEYIGAKRLVINPQCTVTINDAAAYGCIIIQGHGRLGPYDAEAASILRFGQSSGDEYFVSESAARAGVTFSNHSRREPMVVLKHFGPNHPDMPK